MCAPCALIHPLCKGAGQWLCMGAASGCALELRGGCAMDLGVAVYGTMGVGCVQVQGSWPCMGAVFECCPSGLAEWAAAARFCKILAGMTH